MWTRLICGLLVIISVCSAKTYTVLKSLDNIESCPAIPQPVEHIRGPSTTTVEDLEKHLRLPVQWLLRIINIRSIRREHSRPEEPSREELSPKTVHEQPKMLLILHHRPEQSAQQPSHIYTI